MQFGFKRGAAALTLSQTNWRREVSGELCGVTPMLMKVHLQSRTADMQRRMSSLLERIAPASAVTCHS